MPQAMRILMEQYIYEIKKIYSSHLRKVILYGSYAREDFRRNSDIDIKPIAKSEAHFKKWIINYPFYANINKEGVVLYGTV